MHTKVNLQEKQGQYISKLNSGQKRNVGLCHSSMSRLTLHYPQLLGIEHKISNKIQEQVIDLCRHGLAGYDREG